MTQTTQTLMNAKEANVTWGNVIRIYKDTFIQNNPNATMIAIVNTLGIDRAREIFATIANIKRFDGRIWGVNRWFMDNIPHNKGIAYYNIGGIDEIHTAHINNLITELRKFQW